MPAILSTAPGKVILLGEHAVVYHHPAIAVPVNQIHASAMITPNPRQAPGIVRVQAPDIQLEALLSDLPSGDPLRQAITLVLTSLSIGTPPAMTIRITSSIPVASGLGSGAAVSVSLIKALSAYLGHPFSNEQVSELAFQVEKIHHGTPSGIDNTVITYDRPVFFLRDQPFECLSVGKPLKMIIGDTGIQSPTALAVGDVRKMWMADPVHFNALFDQIEATVRQGKTALETGDLSFLGALMIRNHSLLQQLTVSSPELDRLVDASLQAGAIGAKLSGGGRGGNMIALVDEGSSLKIARRLREMGAVRTIITTIGQKV